MRIENINEKVLLTCINEQNANKDIPWGDYYRKYIKYNNEEIFGLYYKDYLDVKNDLTSITKHINQIKEIRDIIDDRPWEYQLFGRIMALVNRVNEVQKELCDQGVCKFNKPIISGIVLCNNFPVGTLFPKKILNYQPLSELEDLSLSKEDKEMIFNQIELWVNSLINHGVYPSLYKGNILVNPDDYSDIIIEGLDGPSVCRVETEKYVKILANKGLDLKRQTNNEFNVLRNSFLGEGKSR